MAFKIYNTLNAPHEAPTRWNGPETFNMTHNGHFSLSQRVGRRLGLSDGSRIELLQDEQYPSDWYIRKTSAKEGFQLHQDGRGALVFDCSSLKDLLLRTVVKDVLLDFRNIVFQLTPSKEGYAIRTTGWQVRKPTIHRKGGQA